MRPSLLAAAAALLVLNAGPAPGQDRAVARVDHLVYAVPDLELGIARIEALLGVRAIQGGRHPGGGTRNALVALGPGIYLEIIGPDPEQPEPAGARVFGIDGLAGPRLVTWAASGSELAVLRRQALEQGVALGPVADGARMRPDGVLLSWQYTAPETVIADGLVPFFIDWGDSPHPSASAPGGARLVALRAEHPQAASVREQLLAVGIDMSVDAGPEPALVAVIEGPRGSVELR
ncbi:MAG: VOC family protein [Gammaproteobacteria bacterium]|nr:VOC family protein [Gammaproteobacteria bacterium]MDH4256356.1 VOC family protein [Gammaproteobacteria bacterium]MDH5309112.1 VOC family protein [Gammaproteobacteria bacterium]